ncbi:hypothetical protein [Trinickia soli]|uniref:Transmembrane protein n=1 Tax=Trinickia soli TaxID=380675 RepID=A0A2N7VMW4_9BURK|nr:hypothetical protein [Trinickia soli]PMS18445.1 hypothetical protein C0Z19_23045 [Trinickia soli]CAB3655543.1 hypothetical protein LMG24076_01161 [Trinickia soli]
MKPLLRAVLVVDAGLYLSSGAVLLLTPLAGLQRALQMTPIEPAMVGQMLGLMLLGIAWLSLRGAVDGAMTIGVARIVGHLTWLAGALVLAWTIGPHTLWLPALGIVPNLLIGGLLVVVGLGGARFAQAVRRREVARAAQGAVGKPRGAPAAAVAASSAPVEPVLRPVPPGVGAAPAEAEARDAGRVVDVRSETVAPPAAAAASVDAPRGNGEGRPVSSAHAPRPPFHG